MPRKPIIYEPGDKVERWEIVRLARIKKGTRYYECRCRCGKIKEVASYSLANGDSKSCSCLRTELESIKANWIKPTHGMTGTPTYNAWLSMHRRCRYREDYKDVKACERWDKFETFLADMGEMPAKGLTLDRIDNAKGYEPSNCRWATRKQQARNRSSNVRVEWQGETMTASELAERSGMLLSTLLRRIRRGMTPQQAVNG